MSKLIKKVVNEIGTWSVFGDSDDGSYVDIADRDGTILYGVPIDLAHQITEEHNACIEQLATYCSESVDGTRS